MSKYKHIIYGDTDSCYIHLANYIKHHELDMTNDLAVKIIDNFQVKLQDDLAPIIGKLFITPEKYIRILEPGREIVGRRGLYKDRKKRYAINVIDDEGKKVDKLKIMGMETKRSDTPTFIQDFLTECLVQVVQKGHGYSEVKEVVDKFRTTYRGMDPWRCGSPCRVKNLNTNARKYKHWLKNSATIGIKPPQMHFSVRAALNTNWLMDFHEEHRWNRIRDGDKVEVIYLKDNPERLNSVAIPVGETYVPEWFKVLPFDLETMEAKLLDRKLFNVVGDVMGWDFSPPKSYVNDIGEEVDDFYE